MTTDNLTRDEAGERAKLVGEPSYEIDLDLTRGDQVFGSTTRVRFRAEPGADTFIDLSAEEIVRAELNGEPLPEVGEHRIRLDGLEETNELTIEAVCAYRTTGTGMHFFRDPVDDRVYLHSQFEPFDAHAVYACFDQPDIKGTFTFEVTAPSDWLVVSNAPGTNDDGRWTFETTPVMSTYITAICAGPFHVVRDRHGEIDLGLWCRESLAKHLDPDELFEITKQGFDFFERAFGVRYAFGKYDQVFCPEYKFGAMENAGCVTFAEGFIFRSKVTEAQRERRAEVILHEMAHMWFGDLVTMRWWNDLWLNESFATYMAYAALVAATRFTDAWTTFATGTKAWAYVEDQRPTTHPIVAEIPDVEATHLNFDGITYAKGASVLKQLAAWVGEDAFYAGLERYFRDHAWGNTELPDFLAPLADGSGRDLAAWAKEWLQTSGVNTLRVEAPTDGNTYTAVDVVQSAPDEYPTLRPHRVGIGVYDASGDGLALRRRIELDVTGDRTRVPDLAAEPVADLILPNDGDHAYAKIRFDDRSMATLTDRLRGLPDPLARAVVWGAAWDMVRDAELPVRDYVRLVTRNAAAETDVGLVGALLMRAVVGTIRYGDPANREAALARFADAASGAMRTAEPGGDHQLAWARAYATAATSEAQLADLRGILDGTVEVGGLAVDTDLRWHLVISLGRAGTAGDELIEAELERDPTDQGRRYAAQARAARPTPEAKEAAWRRVTTEDIPLATMRSILGGFADGSRPELLEPYVDRYFEALEGFWRDKGIHLALEFGEDAYPRSVVAGETIRRTDAYLEGETVPQPIRRLLLEGRDDVARALRARERDAKA